MVGVQSVVAQCSTGAVVDAEMAVAAVIAGKWGVILQLYVNEQFSKEKVGPFARYNQLAIAPNPSKAGLCGPIALEERRRVAEGAPFAGGGFVDFLEQQM